MATAGMKRKAAREGAGDGGGAPAAKTARFAEPVSSQAESVALSSQPEASQASAAGGGGAGDASGEDEARARYAEAIEAAEAYIKQIEAGTVPVLVEKAAAAARLRDEAVAKAVEVHKWALESHDNVLAYAAHAAAQVLENGERDVRTALEAGLRQRLQFLRGLRVAVAARDAAARSPAAAAETDRVLLASLRDDEALGDIAEVHAKWMEAAATRAVPAAVSAGSLKVVRVTPEGTVTTPDGAFEVGARILVRSDASRQTFSGVLVSACAAELIMRLDDGTDARVPVAFIESGRCALARGGSALSAAAAAHVAKGGR